MAHHTVARAASEQPPLDLIEQDPERGRSLATQAYRIARRRGEQRQQAQAAYVLGVLLNRREIFAEALEVLDEAREIFEERACAPEVARCDWQRGVALRFLGHPDKAAELLEHATTVLHKSGHELDAARAERDHAIACNLLDRFDDADTLIASARSLFEHAARPVEVALCDLTRGYRLRQLTRYDDALRVLEGALRTFEASDRTVDRAKTLLMMALVHIERQAYENALTRLQEAQSLFRAADLPMRIAYCDLAQGRAFWRLGRLRQAEIRMEKAQSWFADHDMPRDAADCLLNLGNLAYVEGRYHLARERYEGAREHYTHLGLGTWVARCDQDIGMVRHQQGRFGAALDYLHRAANALEELEVYVWAADCSYALAEIYRDLRQPETALYHIERAQQAYSHEDLPLKEALCEVQRAAWASEEASQAPAQQALEKARQAASASGSARYVSLCDRLLGDLLLERGQASGARRHYQEARSHFAAAGATADEAACAVGLGRACALAGDTDQAERLLQTVLETSDGALPDLDWRAYAELSRIAHRRGNPRQALAHCRRAVEALRLARATIPEAGLAGSFAASHEGVYEMGLRLALTLGDDIEALEIAEESRAQVLAQALRSGWRGAEDSYVGDLRRQEMEHRAAIQALRRRLLSSFETLQEPSTGPAQSSGSLLERLKRHQTQHRRALRRLHAATGGRIESVEPFRWQQFCSQAEETLPTGWSSLTYRWLDDRLVIFHADAEDVHTWTREPSRIEQAALRTATSPDPERRALMFQGNLHGQASPMGAKYRRALYRLLIPNPVSEGLAPDQPLLITPHGSLHHLPFQALESEAGFLAEQAIVSYAPSLEALEGLLQRRRGKESDKPRALLLGVDSFDQPRPALHWALEEVARVGAIYGGQSERLRNDEAVAATLRAWSKRGLLGDYDVLHLASHAYLDAASGALSGLALWDEDLTLVEISRLRMGPTVVVLSACQSGLGEINAGDEIVSLPYAFFAAGARAVIASQWHVDDESTAELMTDFHRHLHAGTSPAEALAQAQRRAIRAGRSPYEWGGFVAMGAP